MDAALRSGGMPTTTVSSGRSSGASPPSPQQAASACSCGAGRGQSADRPDPRLANGRVRIVGMCGDRLTRAAAELWLGAARVAVVKSSAKSAAASVWSSSMKLSTSQPVAISAALSAAFAASGTILAQVLESTSHGDVGSRGETGWGDRGADQAHSSSLSSIAMLKTTGPHASGFASGVDAGCGGP